MPARDFDVDPATVEVVYAEDEEVFRETAIRELLMVGFARSNIHEASNGIEALDHLARLQVEGDMAKPLVVILDVRMPGMDGRECALQIQELIKKRLLRREPFVICISSIHRQVVVDEGKGNFQVVLPKPFGSRFLQQVLDSLRKWWTMGYGRHLPAWKEFSPDQIDIIAADSEPICRMAASMAFTQAGVIDANVTEAQDVEELLDAIKDAQEGGSSRPIILLVGQEEWAFPVKKLCDEMKPEQKRDPFVVCTSIDSNRLGHNQMAENFHAFLPRNFTHRHAAWCLEFCRLWWLTRGDGPPPANGGEEEEEDSEEDEPSEGSASEDGED